ncbi:MAG: hypothetical protein JWO11_4473 [Nocardioides sp.]|nr:hypothetical protein [Nocardioides sp.]
MRRVSLFVAAAVAGASLTACGPKVECNDGTRQASRGRTTCSGHGGVKLVGRRHG